MPQLLGIRIQNYRSLRDIKLGQWQFSEGRDKQLPPMMCFIGANGSGKSTLLDALAFIGDCLRDGVEAACDAPQRGGFHNLLTSGEKEKAIAFELYFLPGPNDRPITYQFSIRNQSGRAIVDEEKLKLSLKSKVRGRPFDFLNLKRGKGTAWTGESVSAKDKAARREIELTDVDKLGVSSLGQLAEHPRIVKLREFLEGWFLSYFTPEAARTLPTARTDRHLDRTGSNLANYVQFLERMHPLRFQKVLDDVAKRIPGIKRIGHVKTDDGRLLLKFNEEGYKDPFYQRNMSDGTLKVFSYLLLLEDPEPRSLIGIEEPENGLYHQLLENLAHQFTQFAEKRRDSTQILVTTHSPYFVDALKPEQVWLLTKDKKGATTAKNTADIEGVVELCEEGIPLGSAWYSNHFHETWSL